MIEYKKSFRTAFELLEKYQGKSLTDKDWEEIAEGMPYVENSPLGVALVVAVIEELKRKYELEHEGERLDCGHLFLQYKARDTFFERSIKFRD